MRINDVDIERVAISEFVTRYSVATRVAAALRSGIHENRIVAVRQTSPHREGTLADLLAVMQTDLRRIEAALREVAMQASFLDQAA